MPKVWLVNVEEVASADDAQYDAYFAPETADYGARFLFSLEEEDLLVSPVPVPDEFVLYVGRVRDWRVGRQPIVPLAKRSRPYSLADSIMEDESLLEALAGLGARGGWVLEAYLDSPRIVALSDEIGIPTDKTHPDFVLNGTILKLNDKSALRSLAGRLDIPTVPGYLASDRDGILAAMDKVARENHGRIYLKKALYGGGFGNLSGTRDELRRRLDSWYNQGEVVVEHALDFASVAGSLMTLGHDSVRFWGVDEQRFDGGHWGGFDFPHPDREVSSELCAMSLRIANAVHRQKARGDLNLDWGLLREGGRLRPMLLECNFRHNGLGQVLRFAQCYFGAKAQETRVQYFTGLRLRERFWGTGAVLRALSRASCGGEPLLIDGPGRRRGAVLMTPPRSGACALAVFGDSSDYLGRAVERARQALA
jgi:hypothetical protein